jgi:TRAP-type C4-dicarboxylate transport system substrate-binding protein
MSWPAALGARRGGDEMSRIGVIALMAATCVAGLVTPVPGIAQDTIKLTLATGIVPTVPTSWFVKDFIAPRLEKYSNGRISTNVQISGSLCSEHKCVEQAKLKQIDLGTVSGGNIGAFGPAFDILNLPYIFKDDASADQIINGWLGDELANRAAKELGLYTLAVIPSYGFRNLDNNIREVKVPADLKGIKLRVTKTPIEFTLIQGWGGVPVPYDWATLYEGLQTKIVNGMYIPDAYVAAQRFYEVTPYITSTGGGLNTHIIFMSSDRYQGLPDWARQAVDQTAKDLKEVAFKIDIEWRERATADLKGKVKFYDPNPAELQLWYKGAVPAWVAVKGTYDPALARRVLQEQGQHELIAALQTAGAL